MASAVVEAVREAGVVGAGGAGFPAYVKLSSRVRWVIVNAAECEPLLRADPYLLRRYPEQVLRGLEIAMAATSAEHGFVAIKSKHREAVAVITDAVQHRPRISVFLLDDFYPAGDEHVLVYEVLGRTVPEGGIPPQVEVLVQNVQTLMNIAAAVDGGQPVLDKWVTVNGWVRRPVTLRVPLGTPVHEVIARAGGPSGGPSAVLEGGPMTGRVIADLGQPVTRTTGALLVLPADHKVVVSKTRTLHRELRQAASICCGCQECTFLCPRNLLGHSLHPDKITRTFPLAASTAQTCLEAFLCSQCSLCDLYACPMGLSPRRIYAHLRAELAQAGVKSPFQGRRTLPHAYFAARRVPSSRLIARLGLAEFDVPAPIADEELRPDRITLPLLMGTGTPAAPRVSPGERVGRGEAVASPVSDRLSVPVHASISGLVEEVSDTAVVIRAGG